MKVFPEYSEFAKKYKAGNPQLVWKTLPADMKTPVAAFAEIRKNSKYNFMLESVEGGANRGRYSIIGTNPDIIFTSREGKSEINAKPQKAEDFFSSLRKMIKQTKLDIPASLPPMSSGLFGYMAYDIIRLVEDIGDSNLKDPTNIPDALFIRPQVLIVFDSVKDDIYIIVVAESGKASADVAYEEAKEEIENIIKILSRPVAANYKNFDLEEKDDFDWKGFEKHYKLSVAKAKEYIRAGDIFQMVPSERFTKKFTTEPFAFYRALRSLNPSPYMFYLDFDGINLIGSSPEILVRVKDKKVTIRPIAGTRKRGKNPAEDEELAKDLLSDQKEISEHLMLLDLGRNDVGRVAEVGSVKVTSQMVIEKYSHVMHIVSNVEGKLRKDKDALDALIAGFPAGTVSGAPKIRAMQIIEELEQQRRGFYGGCVGYFSANGDMDTCIALRTALIKDGLLHLQAGGGIVAESEPDAECQEIYNKAKSLMVAANRAKRYL